MAGFDPVSYLMGQKAAGGGGGGGGGSSTLSGLTDVDISNPTNGQTLVYNATSGKWENGAGGVFVVHDVDGALDKTWQEIHDALDAAKIVVIHHPITQQGEGIGLAMVAEHREDIYLVLCFDARNNYAYIAQTPGGYPFVD